MNKKTTILLGAIAVIAIGVGAYVSMSSPSNESGFKTQSVNGFAPLVINDGTRGGLERYFDIPCNDSGKLDISAFTSMINNPEKCQCVSKYETKFNMQGTARIGLLGTDGIRYPATKAKYQELCPEGRFIAEQNGDLYMIGQCANAVALGYGSHNNPENIYSFNDFQTTCSEGGIGDSCENNSQCESGYCEETTVSKCVSGQYGEKIACAGFTTEEQCLGFKQNVGIPQTGSNNGGLVSVCKWETTTSGICAIQPQPPQTPYCKITANPNPAVAGQLVYFTIEGYAPGANFIEYGTERSSNTAGGRSSFGGFPRQIGILINEGPINFGARIYNNLGTGVSVECEITVPVTIPEPFCGNGILDKGEQCDGVGQAQCGKGTTCTLTGKTPCTCQYSEVIGPDKIPEGTSDGKAGTKDTTQPTSLPTTRSLTR